VAPTSPARFSEAADVFLAVISNTALMPANTSILDVDGLDVVC
jgi:hypothetical protein